MTQGSLELMTVEQFRDYARKNTPLQKTAIVFMKKADLIRSILDPENAERPPVAAAAPMKQHSTPAQEGDQVDLAAAIANALRGRIEAGLDESRVREIAEDAIASNIESIAEQDFNLRAARAAIAKAERGASA